MSDNNQFRTFPDRTDHSMAHPNVGLHAHAWSESQTLHVATAYNNPCRWRTRRELMNDFRRHMAASPNVRLHVGELAYGDRPFEVTEPDHPLDHQFRTRHELWHKENLLNQIIARFPADWEYGAYVDGDFHFTRHDWALEAIHQLQHFDWVQLFSTYSDLSHDHRPLNTICSFTHNYLAGNETPGNYWLGSPGGAWAFRRSAFQAVGGLLDTCILGSGDWYMASGLIGKVISDRDARHETAETTQSYRDSIRAWQVRAEGLKKNVGCVGGHAVHFFHGSKQRRGYSDRWKILRNHEFDPHVDLFRDWQGIYQLTAEKPGLRDAIRRYFRSRNEDDISP